MKHNFTPKALTPQLCATCSRDIIAHSKRATCDACATIGVCNIFGNPNDLRALLLCEVCEQKEKDANTAVIERTYESVHKYGDFFNARVTPIVALKELYEIQNKPFAEFHEAIKLQIEHFARVLFE